MCTRVYVFINKFVVQNRNVRTLLPMTVKQLSELSSNDESSASIDGADVNTVGLMETPSCIHFFCFLMIGFLEF